MFTVAGNLLRPITVHYRTEAVSRETRSCCRFITLKFNRPVPQPVAAALQVLRLLRHVLLMRELRLRQLLVMRLLLLRERLIMGRLCVVHRLLVHRLRPGERLVMRLLLLAADRVDQRVRLIDLQSAAGRAGLRQIDESGAARNLDVRHRRSLL
jgi:hypothetical protein